MDKYLDGCHKGSDVSWCHTKKMVEVAGRPKFLRKYFELHAIVVK